MTIDDREAAQHVPPKQLLQRFEAVRKAADHNQRASALRDILRSCPCFLPASISLGRALMFGKEEPERPVERISAQVEATLSAAVAASRRAPAALSELAHHLYLVDESRLAEAANLFAEAEAKLLEELEDVLATRIEVLAMAERWKEADEGAGLASRIFPDSVRVSDARHMLETARCDED